MVRLIPESPDFQDDSERVAWMALRASLNDDHALLHGVRFTDAEAGEVEIDLLVLFPDVGAAVIEVKGGHITYAGGEVRQTGRDGTTTVDPFGQARRGCHALARYLESRPDWSRGRVRTTWLACFPYTPVTGDLGPEGPRARINGRDELDGLAAQAYDLLCEPALHAPWPQPYFVESVVGQLQGAVDHAAELQARTAARLQHVDQLTSDQSRLLDFVRRTPRFEVIGSAGTGKTWLAMEQARRWAQAGERVAFVSYGRGVAQHVRTAMADLPATAQPAFIGTFHQLGYRWGVVPPEDPDQDFWERQNTALTLAAAERLPPGERFTAFVVDEAQDFADDWWPALLAAAGTDDYRLAVFRDDEQAVFSQRRGRPDVALPEPFVLTENLRNSSQIVHTFAPLIAAEITPRGGDAHPVEFVACHPEQVEATADAAVHRLLEQNGWRPEDIVLLTTQHRHPVQQESAHDKAAYWDAFWQEDDVFYSTVAGFKGLERPVVVLAVDGFHAGIDPRSVMYAGMSRARDLLVVVGDPADVGSAVGEKTMRRLERGRV